MISRVAFLEIVFSHVLAARGAGRTTNGPTATILMTTTMPLKTGVARSCEDAISRCLGGSSTPSPNSSFKSHDRWEKYAIAKTLLSWFLHVPGGFRAVKEHETDIH